jgi:predicted amidophosphoribosyltransferase
VVASAYAHEGAGQRLVHRLKYDAVAGLATLLAKQLVPLVPSDATGLVPVPRVVARRILYGVDHGPALAAALARLTGLPVFGALSAPIWAPAHAGRRRDRRRRPAFRSIAAVPAGAVVVDDVVTTGSTIEHAALALGGAVAGAVTVTSAVQRW